jgi:tetratricopeptide (TPR) repeat protein
MSRFSKSQDAGDGSASTGNAWERAVVSVGAQGIVVGGLALLGGGMIMWAESIQPLSTDLKEISEAAAQRSAQQPGNSLISQLERSAAKTQAGAETVPPPSQPVRPAPGEATVAETHLPPPSSPPPATVPAPSTVPPPAAVHEEPSAPTKVATAEQPRRHATRDDYERILGEATAQITREPNNPRGYTTRGATFNSLGQYELAVWDLTRAIELDKTSEFALRQRGFAYGHLRKFELAIQDLTKAVDLDPKDIHAWRHRGWCYIEQKQHSKAVADFDRAIALNANDGYAYRWRGYAHGQLGHYDLAIEDETAALKFNDTEAGAWNTRGVALMRKGEFTLALADFEHAVALNPKESLYQLNRASALENLRKQKSPQATTPPSAAPAAPAVPAELKIDGTAPSRDPAAPHSGATEEWLVAVPPASVKPQ